VTHEHLPKPTDDPIVPSEFPIVSNEMAFVAEAPGIDEVEQGRPLVGSSGQEFNSLLHHAGILRSESLIANVFNFKLPDNKVGNICCSKSDLPADYPLPPVEPGKYVRPEYCYSLDRLRAELEAFKPRVIVPMGNTALWALTLTIPKITKARGYVNFATLVPAKIVPTFHPAHVLRNYEVRTSVLADLLKAKRHATFDGIRRPERELWIAPTIEDLYTFEATYMPHCQLLSVDIETRRPRILRCIGFAVNKSIGIVVPFHDTTKPNYNYWPTFEEEKAAYLWCKHIVESDVPKLMQGGVYDTIWLRTVFKMSPRNFCEDTQIKHHAIQPELPKDLHFMGSVYTDEVAWKLERSRGRKMEDKDD